ncbi:hypothetical protein BDZ94DRAFT_194027 [Collybia nuda]|uniref:Uncharacterized protein n=1 Tax=Collybia nuda TaxID=64659 RepID=A0A9P5XXY1_9AGAR|nr:hypothetical protein BDZ94DRAFT_194027 [Collybia nuda]
MIQHTTRVAVYSGFTISPDDFKALVKTVCPAAGLSLNALENYTTAYNHWRRSIPKSDRHRVPRPKVLFKPGHTNDMAYDKIVERFFFPIRWVPYEDDNQLERNDGNQELWMPNDVDKAKLAQVGKFVASQPGCHNFRLPDLVHFGFTCIKDVHPAFEWKE